MARRKLPIADSRQDWASEFDERAGAENRLRTADPEEDYVPLEITLANAIDRIVERFIEKLESDLEGTIVPSVSDLVRLMQFRHELKGNEPIREIKVTWIDPYASVA